jgi:hypothetical protein
MTTGGLLALAGLPTFFQQCTAFLLHLTKMYFTLLLKIY